MCQFAKSFKDINIANISGQFICHEKGWLFQRLRTECDWLLSLPEPVWATPLCQWSIHSWHMRTKLHSVTSFYKLQDQVRQVSMLPDDLLREKARLDWKTAYSDSAPWRSILAEINRAGCFETVLRDWEHPSDTMSWVEYWVWTCWKLLHTQTPSVVGWQASVNCSFTVWHLSTNIGPWLWISPHYHGETGL